MCVFVRDGERKGGGGEGVDQYSHQPLKVLREDQDNHFALKSGTQ